MGILIGLQALWIAALVVLLLLLIGAFGVPRGVERLNFPPAFTNAPGEITTRDPEDGD